MVVLPFATSRIAHKNSYISIQKLHDNGGTVMHTSHRRLTAVAHTSTTSPKKPASFFLGFL
ncbi:hypothetical protein BC826DRAFT_128209 [Russula brevipes]|nr:hypothetical protein BC826DRAFT_128209 [Russula brevipes]